MNVSFRMRFALWFRVLIILAARASPLPGEAPVLVGVDGVADGMIEITCRADPGASMLLQTTPDLIMPFSVVPSSERLVAGGGVVSWTVSTGPGNPSFFRARMRQAAKPMLTWAMIEAGFAGTFAVPMAQSGDNRFGYSSGAHGQLANGNLLVVGHPYYPNQRQVVLPETLDGREGTVVGSWIDITGGLLPEGWEGGPSYDLTSILEIDSRLYFTKHQWYNGAGTDWQTQGYYEGPYDGSGTASGMWTADHGLAHHSRVGGYMSRPPERIRTDGFTYLAGLEGTSGAALGRWGPNLFAVQSRDDLVSLPAVPLLCHDSEARAPADWWIANKVTAGLWLESETHCAVLFLVYEGLGEKWYGEATVGDLSDPYGGSKGYHAEGWTLKAYLYDPVDLLAVYEGSVAPWVPVPVEVAELIRRAPGSDDETLFSVFGGAAQGDFKMSCRDGRLIVLQPGGHPASVYERTPLGYVFMLP